MTSEGANTKEFYPIWKKYKPVILKLMIDSMEGTPQNYRLSGHEFKDANTRKTGTFSFKMEVEKGRSIKPKNLIATASDLLATLNQSAKALELMENRTFHFQLDSQFDLIVSSVFTDSDVESE